MYVQFVFGTFPWVWSCGKLTLPSNRRIVHHGSFIMAHSFSPVYSIGCLLRTKTPYLIHFSETNLTALGATNSMSAGRPTRIDNGSSTNVNSEISTESSLMINECVRRVSVQCAAPTISGWFCPSYWTSVKTHFLPVESTAWSPESMTQLASFLPRHRMKLVLQSRSLILDSKRQRARIWRWCSTDFPLWL